MKILILGGTGAMGKHLVSLLNENNNNIFVTSRNKMENEGNITYIEGDAKDLNFLNSLLDDKWDAIVDFMVYSTRLFKERVELLLNSTSQYVFLSSARVYAYSNETIKESSLRLLDVCSDSEYLSTDEYALAKARQEDLLIKSGKFNWTIVRPYITFSENKFQLGVFEKEDWLYRAINGRTIVFSKEIINNLTTLSYGLDVAKCIKSLVGTSTSLGQVFNLTTSKSITWHKVLNIYLGVLEKNLGFRPKYLLLDISDFISFSVSKYQVFYDRMYDREFDNSKICMNISCDSFTELEKGLEQCLTEFLKKPNFIKISWSKEAKKDRLTKERTSLAEIQGVKQKIVYLVFRYLINKNNS